MSNQSVDALELPADIRTIMTSWSLQTGYPIVTVRRNYDLQTAIVTQVFADFRTLMVTKYLIFFLHLTGKILPAFVTKFVRISSLVDPSDLHYRFQYNFPGLDDGHGRWH